MVFFADALSAADHEADWKPCWSTRCCRRPPGPHRTTASRPTLLPGVTDPAATAVHWPRDTVGAARSGGRHRQALRRARRALHDEHASPRSPAACWPTRSSSGGRPPRSSRTSSTTHATAEHTVDHVAIRDLDDDALQALNKERGLSLDLAELHAIAAHYRGVGREPTDVELETLAQTWSEHCAHKTFRARITLRRPAAEVTPLLQQLRGCTDAIDAPFVRSSFVGNAGIVCYTPGVTVAVKAETHNHPSAIEPFGGSNTGVGGVIRDVMGAAHHPIAITDILCFGPTDLPADQLPDGVLHPRLIESGVIAGVADYGNKIGLPTWPARCCTTPATSPTRWCTPAASAWPPRASGSCPARSPATSWWSWAAAPAATACAAPRSAAPPWTPPPATSPAPACRSATRSSRSCSST